MHRTRHDQRGATAVEYAVMIAGIAVAIVGGVTAFGVTVADLFVIPWP